MNEEMQNQLRGEAQREGSVLRALRAFSGIGRSLIPERDKELEEADRRRDLMLRTMGYLQRAREQYDYYSDLDRRMKFRDFSGTTYALGQQIMGHQDRLSRLRGESSEGVQGALQQLMNYRQGLNERLGGDRVEGGSRRKKRTPFFMRGLQMPTMERKMVGRNVNKLAQMGTPRIKQIPNI